MPGTTTTGSSSSSSASAYHRPGYLRALEAYETVKKAYGYGRGFVGVRTVAPLAERLVEGTLARLPVIKSLKEPTKRDSEAEAGAKAQAGYPTLRGIDLRVAALLAHLDDVVDSNLGNPKTLQGRVLRVATHTIYAVANYTPVVGGPIRKLMVDIDPEHMIPRLTDRPAGLDVNGEDGDLLRASFDKDMDDVSVVTDASEEVAAAQGKGKKKKKEKRKDKRFLQNMGKGIKKVINYPRTPVHDITPTGATGTASAAASVATGDAPSIGGEEEASLASGTTPVPPASASSSASIASTDAVASTGGSSSTASTPLRTARKFFAAAAPGSGGKKAKAAAAAAAAPAGANPSSA